VREHPDVKLKIVEGYSSVLTERVLAEDLDFAVVPTFEGRVGLKSRLLARDREMLISGRARGLTALAPMRLADCVPLKIVVPGTHNIRRRNLETYFQTNGIPIEDKIEMDAMIGTLEFVARSDWVAVLPSIICINDVGRGDLVVNPIVDPPLFAEFVVISPARRPLGGEARRFLDRIEDEIAKIRARWKKTFRARTRKISPR
jgi:LysR family transcriptional regulator, nitrogen assimilation regulatory protein